MKLTKQRINLNGLIVRGGGSLGETSGAGGATLR